MSDSVDKDFKAGFVSIVGRPNVGKSTLLNAIVGQKVAIVSRVPQTTRNQIRGIYNEDRGQIVFIDTPGLMRGKDQLDQFMRQSSFGSLGDVDCVIHLVDANKALGEGEQMIMERLAKMKEPLILGLNKVDLKGKRVPEYIEAYQQKLEEKFGDSKKFIILPLSGETGFNIDKLTDLIFDFLPVSPPLYPRDMVSDVPQKIAISDIIREKLLALMRDEIPYSLAVDIVQMERRKNKLFYIEAVILVSESTHKEIVIGKKGQNLKTVGTLAREDLEKILDRRVFLDLNVKVQKKWRDNISVLTDLGYVN
ncbi:MAG: GTPase Era [Candidatus Omnitrophica bacterium]|nr:GTPase Era [Candidatus Omnitrophota bacterium]